MSTELPEVALPTEPKEWKKINSVTISYGHGMATTPLQTAVAAAAMLNGGKLIPPTFLPRSEAEANEIATQVISPKTSAQMRYLFRLNSEKGSGRRAEVEGYYVGGKTGTAEKVVNGRYSNNVRLQRVHRGIPGRRSRICRAGVHRRTEARAGRDRRNGRPERGANGAQHHPPFSAAAWRQA